VEFFKDKNKRTSLIICVLFHTVLLILFAIFGLPYQDPPPEELGIPITFGTTNEGMFSEQNNTPSEQSEVVPVENEAVEPEPEEIVEEEIITQSSEEAPSVEEKKKKEEKVEPVEKKEDPKPDKNLTDAISKWKNKKTEQGGGKGNTGTPGDQGDINGDPNSNNFEGGAGGGIEFSLNGRKRLSSPPIEDNSQDEGEVVVDIIVDKYGKVLRAFPGARGSTTSSPILYKKAKEAAMKTRFSANPNALEEQKGSITFIFILN